MTSRRRVDYDRIAPTYNRRFQDGRPRGTTDALLELVVALRAARTLEVGCGTGRWLADLSDAGSHLFGLDLSRGMLRQAAQREPPLDLARGQAGKLPFASGAFDLVFCVNAIHHFDQQQGFVREARRLLGPGGALAVCGFDPRQHRSKWYIYDYFEGTLETDLKRFPSWGTVLDWMAEAGFSQVEWREVEHIQDPKQGYAVLDDPFLQKDAASQLSLLSETAYAAGLDQIRADLAAADRANALSFPVELSLRALVGWV